MFLLVPRTRRSTSATSPGHPTLHGVVFAILYPGPEVHRRRDAAAFSRSGLGEIQLHADAIGIVEEELGVAGARHDAFAEFDILRLQPLAHTVDIGGGKGNVVEAAGV